MTRVGNDVSTTAAPNAFRDTTLPGTDLSSDTTLVGQSSTPGEQPPLPTASTSSSAKRLDIPTTAVTPQTVPHASFRTTISGESDFRTTSAPHAAGVTLSGPCQDVDGWVDSAGDTCDDYVTNNFCGEKWQVHYVNFGMIADEACCLCRCFPECGNGGGTTTIVTEPPPTEPNYNVGSETEAPSDGDLNVVIYVIIAGVSVIVVAVAVFVGIRLGYRPAPVFAGGPPRRQSRHRRPEAPGSDSRHVPRLSFDNGAFSQPHGLFHHQAPPSNRGPEVELGSKEQPSTDLIEGNWDGKLTSVLQMQRQIQAKVLSKSNREDAFDDTRDEAKDPDVQVHWNSIKEAMERNSPAHYTTKRKQLAPIHRLQSRQRRPRTPPRIDTLRHGWCDKEACRQSQRVLNSLHSARKQRKLVRTLTPPTPRTLAATVVVVNDKDDEEDDPTRASLPIGCTRAKIFEWLFGALIYVEKHFGGPFLGPSLRIMGAPAIWADVWRDPKSRDLLQLKAVAKSRLRKLCAKFDNNFFAGLEARADPVLDIGRPSSVQEMLSAEALGADHTAVWDQYAGVASADPLDDWCGHELLSRDHADGVVRQDQFVDVSGEDWEGDDALEFRYIFVLLRMAVACMDRFRSILNPICDGSITLAHDIQPKEYLLMAMAIELEQADLPRPRPAENTDLLSATLLCETTQGIVRAYDILRAKFGEPIRVRNNFSVQNNKNKRGTSPVTIEKASSRAKRSPFDLRCLKCTFLLPLKEYASWRSVLRSRACTSTWRRWRDRFKSRTAPLMGRAAAQELLRMLDGVDVDIEEFGVASAVPQILVEVNITLKDYYHSFQQGWVWQRVYRAPVPAELCVTVALDSLDGETATLLRSARDLSGILSEQDVVEL